MKSTHDPLPLDPALEQVRLQLMAAARRDLATAPRAGAARRAPRVVRRPRRMVTLVAATLVAASGVAAAAPAIQDRFFPSHPGRSIDRMEVFQRPAKAPLSTSLGVFDEPRRTAVPKEVLDQMDAMLLDGPDPRLGTRLQRDKARVLLDHGSGKDRFLTYAVPTNTDFVCYWSNGGGSCVDEFSAEFPSAWGVSRMGRSTPTLVYGLLPDEVVRVTVTATDGEPREAVMGDNSFFWRAPARCTQPVTGVAHLEGGATRSLALHPLRISGCGQPRA